MLFHLLKHAGRKGLGVYAHRVDKIGRGLPIALLVDIVIEKVARLLLGLALDHIAIGPDLELAAVFAARQLAIRRDLSLGGVEIVTCEDDEGDIAIFRGVVASLLR